MALLNDSVEFSNLFFKTLSLLLKSEFSTGFSNANFAISMQDYVMTDLANVVFETM